MSKLPQRSALFPRLLGEFDKRGTRRSGGQHRCGKVEPGSLAIALQIGAFGIDPGHPPIGPRMTEQTPYAIGDRVGMMLVHMLEDLRLRLSESGGIRSKQQIAAVDPVNPAETGDQVPAFDRDPIETEIGETGIDGARRVVRGEAGETSQVLDDSACPITVRRGPVSGSR